MRTLRRYCKRVLGILFVLFSLYDSISYLRFKKAITVPSKPSEAPRVFIASILWNSEALLKSSWTAELLEAIETIGRNKTYVSIYENGSWDGTRDELRRLGRELGTRHIKYEIRTDDITHEQLLASPKEQPGWIMTQNHGIEMRRIPYLAKLRNLALQPLHRLAQEGSSFDTILFLGDVKFQARDVLNLLATNDGNYASACALDFKTPPHYYDTFALRDVEGHKTVMSTWPYFRSRLSRSTLLQRKPVPVSSCWNGMVVMNAQPFYTPTSLQFRGIPDSLAKYHLEGSECCLIHQDNSLNRQDGIFVNPDVQVSYQGVSMDRMNDADTSLLSFLTAIWRNRIRRWTTTDWFERRTISSRIRTWRTLNQDSVEPGDLCLINEMQVMRRNGWAHV